MKVGLRIRQVLPVKQAPRLVSETHLRTAFTSQLCPMELWHIIKLRRNPQVRKGNSSSIAMKFQLACPPRGFWPVTFTLLCINPSLKTQFLLTTLLLFIPETRLQQDLRRHISWYSHNWYRLPNKIWLSGWCDIFRTLPFCQPLTESNVVFFYKVPNSPLISWTYIEQWNIYKWSEALQLTGMNTGSGVRSPRPKPGPYYVPLGESFSSVNVIYSILNTLFNQKI